MKAYLQEFDEPAGYLDFARFGPVSAAVRQVLRHSAQTIHTRGWQALEELDGATGRAARSAATLLGAAPHEIAFVGSTSHGMFAAAHALPGGGTVLVSRADFPGAVYPWLRAAAHGGLEVRLLDGPMTVDRVREHLDERVRAVSVCAVDAATGFRAPLAAIKELIGPGRVLVVDAVQALGAVEIAADAADLLACGGQKWLRAGWGAALLLVRDRVAGLLRPGLGGWSGVRDPLEPPAGPHASDGRPPYEHPPLPGAVAHTLTNPDGPAVAALGAALDLVLETGQDRIAARIEETLDALLDAARSAGAFAERPGPPAGTGSGIARFAVPGTDPADVHRALLDAGLTTTLRGGLVRLSPHASTSPESAARLREALRAL
ncbi:aminotransferase class V-fold PLP-dependent enzyme [Kitasatospora sp. NPDC004240]